MIRIYPAASRHASDYGWLRNRVSFSIGDYFDPGNIHFGPLRVFNDDVVMPGTGFDAHPHRDMEIVSIVLRGQLLHRDDAGHASVLKPGEIQRMSAGTGIVHSETNPSADEEVNFLQIWFFPDRKGYPPSYEQKAYDRSAMKNALLPVVAGREPDARAASVHQDLTLYLSELEAGRALTFAQEAGRRIYVFVIEGALELQGAHPLRRRDAARIEDVTDLRIETAAGAEFLLIDLP